MPSWNGSHTHSQTATYLATDALAGLVVALTYFASSLIPENNGTFIACLEVLTSLSVVVYLFFRRDLVSEKASRLLLVLYVFICTSDLCYGYFYYWLAIGEPTRTSVLFHEVPLSLSYFLLPITYLYSMRGSIKQIAFHPFALAPLLITLLLMARFVAPGGSTPHVEDSFIRSVELFSLICTFAGLALSITVFVFAKELFWSLFSLGMTTAYIAGLGIRIDRLNGDEIHFTSFEYLWAFGGLISAMAVLHLWNGHEKIQFRRERSIVFSARMVGLIVAFAGSMIVTVTRWNEPEAVETIILTSVISLHIAGVLGHFLWDRLVECSAALERLLNDDLVEGTASLGPNSAIPVEMAEFYSQTMQVRLQTYKHAAELKNEMDVAKHIEATARQVAHDIRSPLAALEVCVRDLTNLPESRRSILRASVNRLRDIANLLHHKRVENLGVSKSTTEVSVQMLPGLVDELVSEKRMQYRSRIEIEIDVDLGKGAYGIFASVNPIEFKRLVSNLIDNAVEAISGKGRINVAFEKKQGSVVMLIQDSGAGIPAHLVSRLGERGASFGKTHGQGLGLFHAKSSLESWGGALGIESEPGKGTRMILRLPSAASPDWFVPEINLTANQIVVILDDETAVHEVWTERFSHTSSEMVHCSTPDGFIEFCQKSYNLTKPILFLCDQELMNYPRTGLDLIEELGIQGRAILVTSHSEEQSIRARCAALGVKLIPKALAGFVPIHIR